MQPYSKALSFKFCNKPHRFDVVVVFMFGGGGGGVAELFNQVVGYRNDVLTRCILLTLI